MEERLQKILSQWGIASRRQAEQMILERRVELNGSLATLGQKANPWVDCITVDGVQIQPSDRPEWVYFLLHKPLGVVSTCRDPEGRSTVMDWMPDSVRQNYGLHPVGRLDTDSTGALLLTNDGSFTFLLTHPKHWIEKTYRVWVSGDPTPADLQRWRKGVMLDGQKTLPAAVRRLHQRGDDTIRQTLLEIRLREGRNRQIRRVAEQLGYPVVQLHRVAIGSLQLGTLARGECRPLTPAEVQSLRHQAQGDNDAERGDRLSRSQPRLAQVNKQAKKHVVSGGIRSGWGGTQ